jgi:hypothetical protein
MTKARAAADLVLRYLTARALFRQTAWDMPADLEWRIRRGMRLLPGGVVINEVLLMPEPAIVDDRNDPQFWSAIIGGETGAIDMDPDEQQQVRDFVVSDDEWNLPVPPSDARPRIWHKLSRAAFGRLWTASPAGPEGGADRQRA